MRSFSKTCLLLLWLFAALQGLAQQRIQSVVRVNYAFGKWSYNDSVVYGYLPGHGSVNTADYSACDFDSRRLWSHAYDFWDAKEKGQWHYDSAGRYAAYEETQSTDGLFRKRRLQRMSYHPNGDTAAVVIMDADSSGTGWLHGDSSTLRYDTAGRRVEMLWQPKLNSSFVPYCDSTYYDASGRIDHEIQYKYRHNNWIAERLRCYTYDTAGRRLYLHSYLHNTESKAPPVPLRDHSAEAATADMNAYWKLNTADSMAYDSAGKCTAQVIFAIEKEGQGNRVGARRLHRFDARGDETERSFDVFWTKAEYEHDSLTYDSLHRVTQCYKQGNPPIAWWDFTRKAYSYDDDGHLIELRYEAWLDGEWKIQSRDIYEYDANGLQRMKLHQYTHENELQPGDAVYIHYEPAY